MTTTTFLTAPRRLPDDARVIALIGFAHGVSHFFHLLPAAALPVADGGVRAVLRRDRRHDDGLFVVSGVGQAMAGFGVDRFGALRILLAGISCFVLAGLGLAMATSSSALYAIAALAGWATPCSTRPISPSSTATCHSAAPRHAFGAWPLRQPRLGGGAAVPDRARGTLAGWRIAAAATIFVAIPAMLLLWRHRALLDTGHHAHAAKQPGHGALDFMRVGAVWLCFAFFFLITAASVPSRTSPRRSCRTFTSCRSVLAATALSTTCWPVPAAFWSAASWRRNRPTTASSPSCWASRRSSPCCWRRASCRAGRCCR